MVYVVDKADHYFQKTSNGTAPVFDFRRAIHGSDPNAYVMAKVVATLPSPDNPTTDVACMPRYIPFEPDDQQLF
jgi:hypothetical protein